MKTRIFYLVNGKNIGDDNAAKAISEKIVTGFGDSELSAINVNSDLSPISEISSDDRLVFVGCGAHMLDSLARIKQLYGNRALICFAAHQAPANILQFNTAFDVVSLPKHAVIGFEGLERTLGDKLVQTVGVSHATTAESLHSSFATLEVPQEKSSLVILGGDAPDMQNVMHRYTEEDAANLAGWVSLNRESLGKIYVTNGPRTGKLNADNTESGAHKEGAKLDEVSRAFIEKMRKCGMKENDDFVFSDFRFATSTTPVKSDYSKLLHFAHQTSGSVIVPGESTSMVSEACDLFPPHSIVIVRNSAMNPVHENHVRFCRDYGVGSVLSFNEDVAILDKVESAREAVTQKSAAQIISASVVEHFKPKARVAQVSVGSQLASAARGSLVVS